MPHIVLRMNHPPPRVRRRARGPRWFRCGPVAAIGSPWAAALLLALLTAGPLSSQQPGPSTPLPIASARVDADGDGVPDRLGDTVTIAGRATTAGTVLTADQLRLFVQDASAGVMVFAFESGEAVERGDSVLATGVVGQYQGLTQIRALGYRVIPASPRVPAPVELPLDREALEALEGSLVRARASVKGAGSNQGGRFLLLGPADTGDELLSVFVAQDHRNPPDLGGYRFGDEVEVTGPLGQFDVDPPYEAHYQIYPRSPEDLDPVGVGRLLLQRIALGAVALLILALAGLWILRREVRRRTRALVESERVSRLSEERLAFFLESAPVVLWTVDRDLRFTWVEGRALDELGVEHDDLLGATVPELFGSDDPDFPPIRTYRRALEGESGRFEIEWGGRVWEVRVRPLFEDGEITGVVGAAQDVTHHREMERRLQEQSTHFRRLFEESPEAIVLAGEDERILEVNSRFEELFGYSAEEAVGRLMDDLVAPPGRKSEAVELTRRVANGETVEVEAVRHHKDGTPIHVSILGTSFRVGEKRRVYGIYRDITEQKSLEAQLLHSQRLEAVGQLAGGVAHDFNNILTAILGNTRFLLDEVDDRGDVHEQLKAIETAAQRAARLTRQLLTFSRREIVSPGPVDVSELVRGMRDFLERLIEERVHLRFDLAEGLPPVECDPSQLEQVVVNLVINARDALEDGGRVEISTGRASEGDGRPGPEPGDVEWVVLEVRDEGRGMMAEERTRIFEPFFTTKGPGEGTGLGLSMVYGIVEEAGGEITVETAPGSGTTVRVCLPPMEPEGGGTTEVPAPKASSASEAAQGQGELVLLVDDDRPVREVTRRILERAGFRVVTADSGEAALEYCDAADVDPDVVLTDLVMPGIRGDELVERLRARFPEIRAIFMTGYTEPPATSDDEDEELLRKPFDGQTLVRRLRERLSGQ